MKPIESDVPDFIEKVLGQPEVLLRDSPPVTIGQFREIIEIFVQRETGSPMLEVLSEEYNDTIVVGDLHGDMNSLRKLYDHFMEGRTSSIVFTGTMSTVASTPLKSFSSFYR